MTFPIFYSDMLVSSQIKPFFSRIKEVRANSASLKSQSTTICSGVLRAALTN